jgi:hypothetical protein
MSHTPGFVPDRDRWFSRIGWGLSAIVGLFLLVDAIMKLMRFPVVLETMAQIGWPMATVIPLGFILLVSTLLYLYPGTGLLGGILLTGYLGGAIGTHARIGSPMLTHTLFGVYLGLLMWLALFLRDNKLRSALPGL